jgi:hypothetical protein
VTLFDKLSLLSIVTSWIMIAATFVGRNWLKARIEKGVQFSFDNKLETLRTEFRRNEERFKADLQSKESEIAALRSAVFSGSAERRSLLDKRRFEAVEKLWKAVNDLAGHKNLGASLRF